MVGETRRTPVQLINVTGSILTLSSKTTMSTPQNHFADILTKGTFTRDAWHHLLRLFNIMNISMFSPQLCLAIQLKNLLSCRSDRRRRANMERRNLAWLPNRDTRYLVALTPNRSSLLPSSSCTLQSPWRKGASCSRLGPGSTGRPVAKGSSARNASSSQVWQADKSMDQGTGRPVAGPNERTTGKQLAYHNFSVSSDNWAFVERVPQERAPKTWSVRARHNGTYFDQRSDLGNIYKCLYVGLCAPRQG